MAAHERYRLEDGRRCIDIRLKHSSQLFDNRDPAPFRERDMDEDAVDYLLASAEEIPSKERLKIVVAIADASEPRLEPDAIQEAVHAHFRYERAQIERRLRQHVRRGQIALAGGFVALVFFLMLSRLAMSLPPGMGRDILREGLIITGWVAMWRPLEGLLYDWWPLIAERRQIDRLLDAPVSTRYDSER